VVQVDKADAVEPEARGAVESQGNPEKRGSPGNPAVDNGAEGRFLRIEAKLDGLAEDMTEVRVAVARIETATSTTKVDTSSRVSDQTFKWMIRGILGSFVIGALSLLARIFGVNL
jgi:hypothetical protein